MFFVLDRAAVRRQTDLVCFKKSEKLNTSTNLFENETFPSFLSYSIKKNEIFIFLVFAADIMSCTIGDSSEWGILVYVIDRFLLVIQ